ncbi:MAG: hypothetical protein IKS55_03955, partial [Oscillospiraceae bacterium]|nr:hypothetical protein [Oscillospiraceae bacterium]
FSLMALMPRLDGVVMKRFGDAILAVTPERAFEIIREEAGKQFDPNLAQVFLNHKDEFAELSQQGDEAPRSGAELRVES